MKTVISSHVKEKTVSSLDTKFSSWENPGISSMSINKKRYLDSLAFTHKSRQRCMMVREQKSSRVFKVWTRHWVFIYWHPALDLTRVHESSWAREIFFVGKKVGMITKSENTREIMSARAWVDVRQQNRESWNYTLVKKIEWLKERRASVVLKEIEPLWGESRTVLETYWAKKYRQTHRQRTGLSILKYSHSRMAPKKRALNLGTDDVHYCRSWL